MCKGCAPSKNSKATFFSNKNRSKGILDLIHSNQNVCGLMLVALMQGGLYYVMFINDYSRKTWTFS